MKAHAIAPLGATTNINDLKRGSTYRAMTRRGPVTGEYLGIEAPYGDRALLLRHSHGTASVSICHVTSIDLATA